MRGDRTLHSADWLTAVRRYLIVATAGNVVWETAQAPLYTIWHTARASEVVLAIMHCSAGDILIATVALVAALTLVGSSAWPGQRFGAVLAATVFFGAGYAVYSEYVNTAIRQNWTYTRWMPTLPWLGIGLTPLAQWLVIPSLALVWSCRAGRNHRSGVQRCTI